MSDEVKVKHSRIRLEVGDITEMPVEAVVFYARPDLQLGSGFGGVLAARGGPKIQEELKKLGTAKTTEVVATSGGTLKVKYLLHAVGPRFQEEDLEEKLRATMRNVFRRAEEKQVKSLAFPAMGAGFYGIPLEVCARETLGEAKKYLEGADSAREIVFCLNERYEYPPFQEQLKKM